MAINAKDIKKLWGLSAGRCSYPGCNLDCVQFFDLSDPTVIGEMAHVIARSEHGPRGKSGGGSDTYENLILLCPTHHTMVDRAPTGTFSEDLLFRWKRDHEGAVERALCAPLLQDKASLCREISRLLSENYQAWSTYGPESAEARRNPLSASAEIWNLRKLSRIVPNNRRIMNRIEVNKGLLSTAEYAICCQFVEHAEGFEANCYSRREGVPRFPRPFQEMVEANARVQ
jgi:hypothetical protein